MASGGSDDAAGTEGRRAGWRLPTFREFSEGVDLEPEDARRKALDFEPRKDDVIIVTSPKSGTTWMQQIVQQIRSKGSMDFQCIDFEIPFMEAAHSYGYTDLDKEQNYLPRAYKTHLPFHLCPKGGKYIVVVRDPYDALPSMYQFFKGWMFNDEVSFEEFYKGAPPRFLEVLTTWYPQRHDSNILWLHYEDLKGNIAACIDLLAEFIGVDINDKEKEVVTLQSSLDFMKKEEHNSKFNLQPFKRAANEIRGLEAAQGLNEGGKVRDGLVGIGKLQMTPEAKELVDNVWTSLMGPICHCSCYTDMRNEINKEFGRAFM